MDRGFVKLWRKLEDSQLIRHAASFQMFGYLLLKAAYKPKRVNGIDLLPGQVRTGKLALAAALDITPAAAQKTLIRLEKAGYLVRRGDHRGTTVTICNWETYQESAEGVGHAEGHTEGHAEGHADVAHRKKQEVRIKHQEESTNVDSYSGKTLIASEPPSEGEAPTVTIGEVVALWNARVTEARHPKLRRTRSGADLAKKLAARLAADAGWYADFREALQHLPLPGKDDDWQPRLEYLLRNSDNARKIAEGGFDFRAAGQKTRAQQLGLCGDSYTKHVREDLQVLAGLKHHPLANGSRTLGDLVLSGDADDFINGESNGHAIDAPAEETPRRNHLPGIRGPLDDSGE